MNQTISVVDTTMPNFTVTLGVAQSLSNNVATKVAFDTTTFDIGGYVDLANQRYTPERAGKYQFNYSTFLLSGTSTSSLQVSLYKNGSPVATFAISTTSLSNVMGGSALVPMNGTTDYVEVWASLAGTGALSVRPSFTSLSGFYVAP